MIDLNYYGWNDKLNQLKQESTYGTLTHGRVTIVHRTCYEVVAGSGAVSYTHLDVYKRQLYTSS